MSSPSPMDHGPTGHATHARRECRRSYFRVRTRLPVRLERLDEADAQRLTEELRAFHREQDPVEDPAMAAHLRRIEEKLDRVLTLLGHEMPRPLGQQDMQAVEISGSGLSVIWDEDLPCGSKVRVDLLVPDGRLRSVRAVAEVISARGAVGSPTAVGLAFCVIGEEDRESIVRFATEVQRMQLRHRAEGERGA